MSGGYLYSGLEASLYDELDELAEFEDAGFYRTVFTENPGPILDVGCGTGRLLVPFAKEGLDIEGLDTSESMLAICRKKLQSNGLANCLHLGDMRNFDLDRKYRAIVIPGFSIQLLADERDAIECLRACQRHLLEGGALVVCSYVPWDMIYDGRNEGPMEIRRSVVDETTGIRKQASQSWTLDKRSERLVLRNRYERIVDASGESLESQTVEMTLRWRLPYDFEKLVRNAGFDDVEIYGDFDFDEMNPMAESIVCVATR